MSGEIEALGSLATGGLVARALGVGRHAARRAHGHAPGDQPLRDCQNCGTLLAGPFCHACGQSGHVHRTIGHVVEEFAHGVFHVESKGWRTLPMLVLNPGRLTREYIHGKRARYIAPLALFLFMVFLTFFTFGFTGGELSTPIGPENPKAEAARNLAKAERDLAIEAKNPDNRPADLAPYRKAVEIARATLARAPTHPVARVGVEMHDDKGSPITTGANWAEQIKQANARGDIHVNTGYAPFDVRARRALQDPEFTAYKVKEKAAKLSFLLVPLSLPFLWLLFVARREVTLYDHTVFALYSLSFMLLLMVAVMLVGVIGLSLGVPFLLLAPPIHMFAQLKGAYRLTNRGALWRAGVLSIASLFVLALFFGLMLLIGLID